MNLYIYISVYYIGNKFSYLENPVQYTIEINIPQCKHVIYVQDRGFS